MKQIIVIVYLVLQANFLFAQQDKRDIHKGNQLYEKQKYAEAEASYQKSVAKSKASVAGNFNLGDAFYKQKKLDKAAEQFNSIVSSSNDDAVKAKAYHNLGNTLLKSKKLEESIAAYKKSLMSNPKDDQTRYNLAYAMEKLKQQQQQQKKDKKNKDQDKKNKDKNKDQQKKDQDKKDQDKKDKQDQDKNKDQDKKDGQDKQKPQPDKLSKEDAQRMLDALNNEEKNTQDKLKNKKAKGVKGRIVKDW